MSNAFDARPCGRGAWRSWLKAAGIALARLPLEAWAVVLVLGVGAELVFRLVPLLGLGLVASLTFGLRRPVALVAQALLAGQRLSLQQIGALGRAGWSSGATWLVLSVLVFSGGLSLWVPDGPPAPWFVAWVLGGWCVLCLRPWGPVGLIGELVAAGCPPLLAFSLQGRAVIRNLDSFLMLGGVWFGALPVVVGLSWLGLPAVLGLFLPATLAWLVVMHAVYQDVFGGGLSIGARAPVLSAPARAVLG